MKIQTAFLFTSTDYTPDLDKPIDELSTRQRLYADMAYKTAYMLHLNGVRIVSNSKIPYCDRYITDRDDIIAFGQLVNVIVVIYTHVPASQTPELLKDEPYLSLLLDINRFSDTIYIDYFERSWKNTYLPGIQEDIITLYGQTLVQSPFEHTFFLEKCKTYFKRELYPSRGGGMLPFPEPTLIPPFPNEQVKYEDKCIDVFCPFGQFGTGMRFACAQVCERLSKEGHKIVIRGDLSADEYIQTMRSSFITLDAYGAGQQNRRFLEIIASGSVCFREKYTITYYKDYDAECIQYVNELDLYLKLNTFLKCKKTLIHLANSALQKYRETHTPGNVGKYILENC